MLDLGTLEQIILDPTQAVAARIMAVKVVLPFMLPKLQEPRTASQDNDEIVRCIQEGSARARAVQRTVECLELATA